MEKGREVGGEKGREGGGKGVSEVADNRGKGWIKEEGEVADGEARDRLGRRYSKWRVKGNKVSPPLPNAAPAVKLFGTDLFTEIYEVSALYFVKSPTHQLLR